MRGCRPRLPDSSHRCALGYHPVAALPHASGGAAYPERVRGDGDGWVVSDTGKHYWGRHGAAGLLLRRRTPTARRRCCCSTGRRGVIRAEPGVCRAVPATATRPPRGRRPGGARGGRPARRAAVGAGNRRSPPRSGAGGTRWTYTTVVADAAELLQTVPNRESAELRWVGEDEVAELPLHPGFAASWHRLRTAPEIVPLSPATSAASTCHARSRSRTASWCGAPRATRPGAVAAESRVSSLLQAPN